MHFLCLRHRQQLAIRPRDEKLALWFQWMSEAAMHFELLHTNKKSKARAGVITTDHGKIETPIFMPVGTAGTVKAVHQRELEEDISAKIILGNGQ